MPLEVPHGWLSIVPFTILLGAMGCAAEPDAHLAHLLLERKGVSIATAPEPFTDCVSLKEYLRSAPERFLTSVPVFGHNWLLRYRTPEEILCGELQDGLVQEGDPSRVRLRELRNADQFILTFERGAGKEDQLASAMLGAQADALEDRFVQRVGGDTLPCRFAHIEAVGNGPWASRILLSFDRDTTHAEREIILMEIPGTPELRVRMPLSSGAFIAHAEAARIFHTPNSTGS